VVALRFDLGGEVFEMPYPRDVAGVIAAIQRWNRRLRIVCVAE
jgi:hypothetical protein